MLPPLREDDTLPLPPGGRRPGSRLDLMTSRYVLLEEIAQGGMGTVYRVHDPDLHRTLALKVLHAEHRGDAEMVRRFLEEARIAGQLQHPGVVPVHEIGRLGDGRPFFTMKLVEGRTLAALLSERPFLDHDLSRFLEIFERVAQTMAYAHAQGVLHRDLKPTNIMVGAFGEVQVMDWGLAKFLGEPPDPNQPVVDSQASTWRPDQTQAGLVVGTPAYMSPEQAVGAPVDERADVFGLGGMLAEILTGKPPFLIVLSAAEWLVDRERDLPCLHARLRASVHDQELLQLALDCLQENPYQRPRNAQEVAERVLRYRTGVEDRLRRAEVERAAAESRAEASRARARASRLQYLVALVGLVLLGCIVAFVWYHYDRQRDLVDRFEVLMAQVDRFESDAEALKGAPDALAVWRETLAALDRTAEAVTNEWGTTRLQEHIARRRERLLATINQLTFEQRFLGRLYESRLIKDDAMSHEANAMYHQLFRDANIDLRQLSSAEALQRLQSWSVYARREVVIALDDWIEDRRKSSVDPSSWRSLIELAANLDMDTWRANLRRRVLQTAERSYQPTLAGLELLARAVQPAPLSPWLTVIAAERLELVRHLLAEATRLNTQELDPATVYLLASLLRQEGELTAAAHLLRVAQRHHPRDLWLNYQLAFTLNEMSDTNVDEAIQYYTAVRAIRPEIGHALAHALEKRKRIPEAIELFRELIRIRPDNPDHYRCLGHLYTQVKRYDDAQQVFTRLVELRPQHAVGHYYLGNLHARAGKFDLAEQALREAYRLDPQLVSARLDLGNILLRTRQYAQLEKLIVSEIDRFPRNPVLWFERGVVEHERGDLQAAMKSFQQALALDPTLPQANTNLALILIDQRKDLSRAEQLLRHALSVNPALREALQALAKLLGEQKRYSERLDLLRALVRYHPQSASALEDLVRAEAELGLTTELIRTSRVALHRFPQDARLAYRLGLLLSDYGQPQEAMTAYRQALAIRDDYAEAHCNLGILLRQQGDFEQARTHIRRGHELGSAREKWPYPSARWLADVDRLVEIEGRLDQILASAPFAVPVGDLITAARVCQLRDRHVQSVALFVRAVEVDSRVASASLPFDREDAGFAAIAAAAGRGKGAESLSAADRHALRRRALTWLTAELNHFRRVAQIPANQTRVVNRLRLWLRSDRVGLARSSDVRADQFAEEREAWDRLFQAIHAMLP
ncbi:MAG: tetratricopeptide repeat protein [Gemmataceae bacterium]